MGMIRKRHCLMLEQGGGWRSAFCEPAFPLAALIADIPVITIYERDNASSRHVDFHKLETRIA
jgi:hypothetical protein